jgi:hypothetical protein
VNAEAIGEVVENGDANAAAGAIARLTSSGVEAGRHARTALEARYERRQGTRKFWEMIGALLAS